MKSSPPLQLCIDRFETLQSSSTWIVNMHVIFVQTFLFFSRFGCLYFVNFNLKFYVKLQTVIFVKSTPLTALH